ncbi:MMPL family transporter [Nonomuraea sp. H19]|uniref:MMPL family transporter n=1 Tax=Nonomuraea sp. H19 TaxID=3452206 RepID=UPI003F886918
MFESVGRLIYRGRRTLLVLSLAAAVLAALPALELPGRVAMAGADVVVLYRHPTAEARDARYKKAVHDSLRRLPGEYVREVATYWTTGAKGMVSKDGHATYALVTLEGEKQAGYAAIADRLKRVRNLHVEVGGAVPLLAALNDRSAVEPALAAAVALLALLVVVFGGLVAAGPPLLVGLLAVLGGLAPLTEVTVLSLSVVTALGFGLGLSYSMVVVRAFREEIGDGASNEQAVARTMATAGRVVACSGPAVAIALLGLLLSTQPVLRSIGLGGAAAALVATGSALIVLPAALAMRGAGAAVPRGLRRPPAHAAAVTVVLVSLGAPVLLGSFGGVDSMAGGVDHRVLPAAAESRRVAEAVARDFAEGLPDAHRAVVGGPAVVLDDLRATLPWVVLVSSVAGVALVAASRALPTARERPIALPAAVEGPVVPVDEGGPVVTFNGRPAVFGADTDPVPLPVAHGSGDAAPLRRHPYATPPATRKGEEEGPRWVKVTEGRTRVVRPNADGSGWMWAEVES